MRQSAAITPSAPDSVRQSVEFVIETAEELGPGRKEGEVVVARRLCVICHQPGIAVNAKVHPGECARKRKSQLQRLLRWRRRR